MSDRKHSIFILFVSVLVSIVLSAASIFAVQLFNIPEIPPIPTITSTGNTYHVDGNTGSDSNDGSSANPLRTIQHGVNQLNAGDTLIVHEYLPGYNEYPLSIPSIGTSDNWITIKGAEGENVFMQCCRVEFGVSAQYILFKNIDITSDWWDLIKLWDNSHHIVLDDIEVDCQSSTENYTGVWVYQGVNNIWFSNMDVHHCGYKTPNPTACSGICITPPLISDITFLNVTVRENNGDGIGTGSSDVTADSVYFDGCTADNNTGDGFDISATDRVIFKNTVSSNNGPEHQGNGFKIWAKEAWLINSTAFNNAYTAVSYKPHWDYSNIYVLNSTFVDNYRGSSQPQITIPAWNTSKGTPFGISSIYLYNNIFYPPVSATGNTLAVHLGNQCRQTLAGEDNNYYFSDQNGTAFRFSSYVNAGAGYVECQGVPERNYTFTDMGDGTWYGSEPCGPGLECGENNIGKVKTVAEPDPGFTDIANYDIPTNYASYDLSLAAGSPAIDAGIDLRTAYDIDGYPRPIDGDGDGLKVYDMGAFEYCLNSSVRIWNNPTDYYLIQTAYDAAQNGEFVESIRGKFTEDLTFDLSKSITLDGGYDCGYAIKTGTTIVNGNVTISDGTVTIGGFEIGNNVLLPDPDKDGILNDGDGSGLINDNPCASGNTVNCDDNCLGVYNPNQEDSDGDGIGDVCDEGSVNIIPTADAGGPYAGIEGATVIVANGSGSSDPDGSIIYYLWDMDNDGTYEYGASTPTFNYTYAQDGTYTVRLRVIDDLGTPREATATAVISDTAPTAAFTGTPLSGMIPLNVYFTSSSTGYDQPLSYAWDFDNDGTVDSTAENPLHAYTNSGTYTVKLTVTDSDGSINTLTETNYIRVATAGWYNTSWLHRQRISIDRSMTATDQNNFPLLVKITDQANHLFGNGRSDGYDILFTSSDGTTKLDHEIEYYRDTVTKELDAWIRIPLLSSAADTVLYMYYGNADSADQGNPSGVWDSDYVMVQHLEESPADGVSGHMGSTINPVNCTPQNFQDGGGGSSGAAGQIDGADDFAGDDDYLDCGSTLNFSGSFTLEAWFNPSIWNDGVNGNKTIASKYQYYGSSGWVLGRSFTPDNAMFFEIYDGQGREALAAGDIESLKGTWVHTAAVFESGQYLKIYINGVETGSLSTAWTSFAPASTYNLTIGKRSDTNLFYTGQIDEVRISTRALSADWIDASHKNQSDPGAYIIMVTD